MTLSIDVLPAPFGPIMARTSPLRMSRETSLIALRPPNDSETFSTESSTSPTATSGPAGPVGALMRPDSVKSFSRLQHRLGDRFGLYVRDLHPRLEHALAAVLEGDLGRDIDLLRTVIKRANQRLIAISDEAAPHFQRASQLAVVSVQFLMENQKAPDLRARHHLFLDQRAVHLLD